MVRSSRIFVLALVASTTFGCGALRRLAGNDTVNLEKADVKSMSVDLRRQNKTICPREPVQMAVFAEVVLDGEKEKKTVETWQGKGSVNKNDKLEFDDFAFHSDQGAFDRDGWFSPNRDVLMTAGKEFEIKSVFRKRPDKFSFTTTYKPDYTCIKHAGAGGAEGNGGKGGSSGDPGRDGQSGSGTQSGGTGGNGSAGGDGSTGSDGGAGPRLTVYATMVKTPFYDRLVALVLDGDKQDFLLVPDGQAVTIKAHGGAGGHGGQGGQGGHGGHGGAGNPGGQGGIGGSGGKGGHGGNGGQGGQVDLMYDTRFPELKNQIHIDVSGGAGGGGGPAGQGGGAGSGGSGISAPSSSGTSSPPAQSGNQGTEGSHGAAGASGSSGQDGHAGATPGAVKDKFGGHAEITVL